MKKFLAIVGAAVAGLAAGILVAPKSGKETREDIKKKAGELKVEAEKRAEQVKTAAKEGAEKAKKVAQDGAESLRAGSKKVGEAVSETARDMKQKAEKNLK